MKKEIKCKCCNKRRGYIDLEGQCYQCVNSFISKTQHQKELEDTQKKIEKLIVNVMLMEFNWRWKAYLKSEYTHQQFSTGFRKFFKKYGGA